MKWTDGGRGPTMTGVTDPLDIFRKLLARDREAVTEGLPAFRERLRARRATYGGRDLVKTIRPKFLASSDLRHLDYTASVITGACRRLADRVFDDPSLHAFIGMTEGERRLCALPARCPDPIAFARLDAFATAEGFRYVELNGEVPAGCGYGDVIAETFREHPLVAAWAEAVGARTIATEPPVLDHLLLAWRAAGGGRKPVILVTDYLDAATLNEFEILVERWRERGFECVLEDPRSLGFRDGRLWAKGLPIDLVYRRVLVNEYLDRENEVRALGDAVAAGAVVMVNPFRSKLLHKKVTFALLHGDGLEDDWLTREERRVIRETIPWTCKVREAHVRGPEGTAVDLLPWAVGHRDELVLKPSDDYGGRGVTLGWTKSASEFESALLGACSGDWVLQSRVGPLEEPYPMFEAGLDERPMTVDVDPYVHFGRVHGVLARLAAGAISNVTSGGGQVPIFYLPDEEST